jgi:hypothetical protein
VLSVAINDGFHRQLLDGCSIVVWMGGSLAALITMSFILGTVLGALTAKTERKLKRI